MTRCMRDSLKLYFCHFLEMTAWLDVSCSSIPEGATRSMQKQRNPRIAEEFPRLLQEEMKLIVKLLGMCSGRE